jgi:hypothetical protein
MAIIKFLTPRIQLPKIIVPPLRLPKLPSIKFTIPKFNIPNLDLPGKINSVKRFFNQALSPIQNTFKKLTSLGAVSNLTAAATKNFIRNTLVSAAGTISNVVQGVIDQAIGNAVASVNAALGTIAAIGGLSKQVGQSAVNAYNSVNQAITSQNKKVKDIVNKEVITNDELALENFELASIDADIKKNVQFSVKNLSNNEKKEIAENPVKRQEVVNQITQTTIEKTTQSVEQRLNNVKEPVKQTIIVNDISTLQFTQTNNKLTRLDRLSILRYRKQSLILDIPNKSRRDKVELALNAEIARLQQASWIYEPLT